VTPRPKYGEGIRSGEGKRRKGKGGRNRKEGGIGRKGDGRDCLQHVRGKRPYN